jgi:hypothetical protein
MHGTLHSDGNVAADAQPSNTGLARYDAACRALAEACSVDEVKDIRDKAIAMAAYAQQAKDRELGAKCVALRLRATRRLGELIKAQRDTVGLNRGAAAGGTKTGSRGVLVTPRDLRPTLASQGIDKNLAKQARKLAALSEQNFDELVDDTRKNVNRVASSAGMKREREPRQEPPTVHDYIATVLDACVQVDEVDAVLAYLNKLRNTSEIRIRPDEFEQAALSLREELLRDGALS